MHLLNLLVLNLKQENMKQIKGYRWGSNPGPYSYTRTSFTSGVVVSSVHKTTTIKYITNSFLNVTSSSSSRQ